jgi:hypothetical protein
MRLLRYLQHWLTGSGPRRQGADVVPEAHPIRQWADTFPWAALVAATDRRVAQRVPKRSNRGRSPTSTRVVRAFEWLKQALGCSDEDICHRMRTDFAVRYAWGLSEVHVDRSPDHVVWPELLAQCRGRLDDGLMDELVAIQAAAAMDESLVRPAPRVIDPFPSEHGRQRVTAATTLDTAQKKSAPSSRP